MSPRSSAGRRMANSSRARYRRTMVPPSRLRIYSCAKDLLQLY